MSFPMTLDEYLRAVARETARLSWPGRMWPVLVAHAKADTELYFTRDSFVAALRRMWVQKACAYDSWHAEHVAELAASIDKRVGPGYSPRAAAAKLIDAFMYQLVKYEEYRFLWADLHLVLDGQVFQALRAFARTGTTLASIGEILKKNPYKISPEDYESVQRQLGQFMAELNSKRDRGFRLTSRIQLNVLWATP